eukprot:3448491-Rhodomonas_salina.1
MRYPVRKETLLCGRYCYDAKSGIDAAYDATRLLRELRYWLSVCCHAKCGTDWDMGCADEPILNRFECVSPPMALNSSNP